MKSLYMYNLFPRLYENAGEWTKDVKRISNMGFNSIYINPFHYPGFSGSLYAIKDYYQFNPLFFIKNKSPEDQLKEFIDECKKNDIDVFMDLVVNHTSIDSVLINDHKNWYLLDEKGNIKNPGTWENGKYISWGDLASFNLENSSDKENLWKYLHDVCKYFLQIGFKGFRCDAAYQVSTDFWRYLISDLKKEKPDILFLAETLGCTPVQIKTMAGCGFDYIFNSSKWWNFNESWCLEQYSLTRNIAPSISFPETHDTERLYSECRGNNNAFFQRVYFEAIFSKGFMVTGGLEFGYKKKLNVVITSPKDRENNKIDFQDKIKSIITTKKALSPLNEESLIGIVEQNNWQNVFCFYKEWQNERVLVIINKDSINNQKVLLNDIAKILASDQISDFSPENRITSYVKNIDFVLKPGEVKIFADKKIFKS